MKEIKPGYVILFLIIIYSVGFIGLSMPEYRAIFQAFTFGSLLLSAIILFLFHNTYKINHILAFLIVLAGGYLVEVAGVKTGIIFGSYHYGKALGPKIMETPLIIGINWLMLIYMTYSITGKMNLKPFAQVVMAASMMVSYDLLLEPVAIQLDFWSWGGNGIPLQNYLAWWVISAIFIAIWRGMNIRASNSVASGLFIIQFIFFLMLNLIL
ncbi:MAG: carotenoid biosynthesis protein [Bacteroidales bacterium]|nr:carotenoid biosynthesis protein [Bacteroidales bacterium]